MAPSRRAMEAKRLLFGADSFRRGGGAARERGADGSRAYLRRCPDLGNVASGDYRREQSAPDFSLSSG